MAGVLRCYPVFAMCLLCVMTCGIQARAGQPSAAAQPNILLVTIDTLRADHVGCYGYKRATTPAIDRIAAQGTVFTRAFSNTPWTTPSHFCFMTGALVSRHGSRDNLHNRTGVQGRVPVMISEVLRQAGYETAAFVSGYPLLRRSGLAAGFDFYDDDMQDKLFGGTWKVERRAPDTAAAFTRWWQARGAGKPWFAWVHLYDPHGPYTPLPGCADMFVDDGLGPQDAVLDAPGTGPRPPEWTKIAGERQDRQFYISRYDAEIRMADDALRDIAGLLEKAGALGSAIIVVSADHGEYLGEHGRWFVHDDLYSQSLMIPLVFSGPGVPRGGKTDSFAESIDVAPTLLALAGIEPPASMMGKKLFSEEGTVLMHTAELVLSESPRPSRCSVMGPSLQLIGPQPPAGLHDYRSDPLGRSDLVGSRAHELKTMRQFAADAITRARTPWPADGAPPAAQPRPSAPLSGKDRDALKSLGYVQ